MNTTQQPLLGDLSKSYSIKPVYLLVNDTVVLKRYFDSFGKENIFELSYNRDNNSFSLDDSQVLFTDKSKSHFEVLLGGFDEAKKIAIQKSLDCELQNHN